jgi:ABC-type transport system involved in cytochrome c biogenesis permease subunit
MTHILDSTMIYIHPPLSIIGYAFVFLSFALILVERKRPKQDLSVKRCLYAAWFFNLMGLISGMLWAQLAWDSYWSWDPKETLTLLLFICIGISAIFYERQKKASFVLLLLAILCIVVNIIITVGNFGLHSYNL